MALARELAQGLLHLLYPGVCPVCDRSVAAGEALPCAACRSALTVDPHASCPLCGATIGPFALVDGGCSVCRDSTFQFERVLRLGPYDGLLREVILRMKRGAGENLAEHIGAMWFQHAQARLREVQAQVVIPVPLHWWRFWTRGYNQSEVIAGALANGLGIPCQRRWLRRVRATPYQTRQTPAGRRQNVHGAFEARARSRLQDKTALLVDDVLTTGSTCSDAARALRKAGARRVVVAVLAKSKD
jgi:ComF family protein